MIIFFLKIPVLCLFLLISTGCADFAQVFGDPKPQPSPQDSPQQPAPEDVSVPQPTEVQEAIEAPPTNAEVVEEFTQKEETHVVQRGESLTRIARQYQTSGEEIARLNQLKKNAHLKIGQKLIVRLTQEPILQQIEALGDQPINGEVAAPKAQEENVNFIWPVAGRVSSGFGNRHGRLHDGIDISAKSGTPIKAVAMGKVLYSGRMSGYGNLLIIKHQDNFFSAYAHLAKRNVREGQKVKQGQLIGTVGRTGRASSPHLHFEIRHKTRSRDPLNYLPRQ